MAKTAGDGASEGLWGCSVVVAAAVVHPWGAGGGAASTLEECWRRLPMHGALAAALAAARQRDYGGGAVGAVGGGSASLGWRWRVSYVGALAAAPWEQLDNQLDCDGKRRRQRRRWRQDCDDRSRRVIWMVEEPTHPHRHRHRRLR